MICANLHAFLASSLSTAEADAFRAHLTDCATCQRKASTTMQIDALARKTNDASPREMLRQFARDVLAYSRKHPSEPEKVIADVLGTSPEAERLATSEAARVAAEERARVLGEAANGLADALNEALTYVPEYFRDKHQIGVAELAALASLPAAPAEEPTK